MRTRRRTTDLDFSLSNDLHDPRSLSRFDNDNGLTTNDQSPALACDYVLSPGDNG